LDKNQCSADYWNSTVLPELVDTFFAITHTGKRGFLYFHFDYWVYLYDDGWFVYEPIVEE
jgi:hypothetical protein